MSTYLEIQLIAIIVGVACALPGVFLVLRRMAMMSDAISHTVLLGIVLGFFAIGSLESPLLVLAAAAVGVLTVSLVELLIRTRLVRQDAAIGLVFPALFSVAVILISRFARGVHLDVDAVLLGELAFAPLDRVLVGGLDLPRSLVVMGVILLLNVAFIALFYKELKLTTFDAGLAVALGFSPVVVHYGLMIMVSVTAVGAFDAVGSILVVALMITPPAAAYLLTDRLSRMLLYSAALAAAGAIGGFWLAVALDANVAGAIAAMLGVLFLGVFLLAPSRGLLAQARRRGRQRWEFAQTALTIHLLNHQDTPEMARECRVDHLHYHLRWEPAFATTVVGQAERAGLIQRSNGDLRLTTDGRERAQAALAYN
ncbi:MAG: metal ABC transporter permease [Candidatus Promineofilum sp.]|nr:metal ABC transporter permease [Promineifilum sp.]